ncbi:TrkA family potassium uptake protein [Antrihabitans sp. YC2-6]|uniref:potassium channel family protein n=1 Tax=Antrihabitans sp. YC2-6 TaxID=2799498 RepID=UPI0018F543AC|nr:NAD-binding protein [Antrihabitans sp. YC2-6]MBJ8344372.1 NAD-binding protein [Antrihabitans sp. YC2-6]
MANPLLIALRQLGTRKGLPPPSAAADLDYAPPSASIFLVMRRLRAPLITLIVLFAISVVGLALIPGVDPAGNPYRLTLFDSFYVISYTATTIGFGELPYPFTTGQRLWLTVSIYLSVVGWAYAIGSMLTMLGDQGFRRALALQRFARKVDRLREPYLLLAGYGQAGRLLVKAFDELGQRVVVLDKSDERIEALDLEPLHADIPMLVADAASPRLLTLAGLGHANCAGVLALTDNDETNLTISMTAALLRPDLPVFARTDSAPVADRLRAFGTPTVVNPFDLFGDNLRVALRAPATYQLLEWLEAGPGARLPQRGKLPPAGRWVMCGYGRFGRELTADLRAAGLDVTVIESTGTHTDVIAGDASELGVLEQASLDTAIGLVAATDNDTTNLSILVNARQLNSDLFLAARQNRRSNAALFKAMEVDALLVPTEVVARQVYAQISTPLLWRFLREVPARGNEWAADLVDRLHTHCGRALPALWKVTLDRTSAPALVDLLADGRVTLAGLLRDPEDRNRRLKVVPLLLARADETVVCPDDEVVLAVGDELLFAGNSHTRRELQLTMLTDSTASYVLFDRHVAAGLIWRKLSRRSAAN